MTFYAISALVNFITSSILGIIVIIKNRSSKNVSFFLFCFFVAFWSIAYYFWQVSGTREEALFWSRTLMAGAIFIPIAYLHFVYALVEILPKRKYFLWFSYLLFFIFFLTNFTSLFVSHIESLLNFKFWPIAGPIYGIFLAVWFFYIIYSTYLLIKKYKNSTGVIRSQIKYVIIGMVIGFAGGSTNYFLWYRIPIPPFANILVSIYVASIAYAILRYRLMDIRIVARKIFFYIGAAVFTYAIYYSVSWFYIEYFGGIFTKAGYTAGLIIAPLFVAGFFGISKLLNILANRYFFSSLYSYQETINKLTDQLTYSIDLKKIVNLIVDTIQKTIHLERAGVLLIEPNTTPAHYQIAKVIGFNEQNGISLVQDSALTKQLQRTKAPLVRDELIMLASDAKTKKDKDNFKRLHDNMEHIEASLCLPLMSGAKLIGIIVLGGKISGDAYTTEDLELLNTLSKQAGIAIENARLYKRIEKFNATLQEKVDEQTKDLKQKNKYNEELLNIKSDFLHIVNHQLNTPLSVMRNAFSMLESSSIDSKKGMEYLKGGLKRMSETIKDFWDAFELEGQEMELEPKETDIKETISSQVEEKKQMKQAQEKGLEIKVENPNFDAPKVFCDPKKIVHVISNLLDNAIYYTSKGSVSVFYELDGKNLKIKIIDTGAGISKEDQKNLFKKFSRGKDTESMRPDGSGLGLYIAKRIIDGHGGELKLEQSKPGKGTTFSFTLPIYSGQKQIAFSKNEKLAQEILSRGKKKDKESAEAAEEDKAEEKNNTNPKNMKTKNNASDKQAAEAPERPKILMVEDEVHLVDMYKNYLMKNGFDFYNTKDIEEALVIAKTAEIDVILLDIVIPKKMPDGSIFTMAQQGWDFLKMAKKDEKTKDIPVIVWTNLNSEEDKKKSKNLGADGFIFKGNMEPAQLIEEIKKY